MRNYVRGLAAALLTAVLVLSLPAFAAPRQTRAQKLVQSAKRAIEAVVPWLYTRISPPGGSPAPAPDQEETTTTDAPAPKPTQ